MANVSIEGNVKKLVDKLREHLLEFVGEEYVYSHEKKQIVKEKVKSMTDQEILDLYLNNHKYYLEIVPKMINEILRREGVSS